MSVTQAVTGIIVGCVIGGLLILVAYIKIYRNVFFKPKSKKSVKTIKRRAFSVGGNLVKELVMPISDVYEITKTLLGSGSSAEVVIGTHLKTQRRYAVKIIDITKSEVAWRYEREKNYLRDIDHTNVVRLYEVYTSPVALFFVMELCTGGHLGQSMKKQKEGRLDEITARRYILQITRAIHHCHKNGICHRDIKLQNILLENNTKDAQIKLVDFGNAARYKGNTPMTKEVGTTYTLAPEVIRGEYDERCDVWSLGVVAYILLSGRRPFEGLNIPGQPKTASQAGQRASILAGRFHFKHAEWEEIDHDAIHFIHCCLEPMYTKRVSAGELLDHPWLVLANEADHQMTSMSDNSVVKLKRSLNRNMASHFAGLQHTSMLAVAFSMPPVKAQQMRTMFQEIDKNGSGTLERDEFVAAMQQVNPDMSAKDIAILFTTMDLDGNNSISFMEFMAATVDPREVDIQEMNQAFRLIDKDHKGFITKEDLMRVLATTDDNECEEVPTAPVSVAPNNRGSKNSTHSGSGAAAVHGLLHNDGAVHAFQSLIGLGSHSGSAKITDKKKNRKGVKPEAMDSDNDEDEDVVVGTAASQARRLKKLTKRITAIIEAADVNHDGVVSYTEFLFAMAEGTGLTDASNLDALTVEPAMPGSDGDVHNFLPSFNRKLVVRNWGRRQTDQILNKPKQFTRRKASVFTVDNNSSNSLVETPINTWIYYFSSFLPLTLQSLVTPKHYIKNTIDRVEHRGKGVGIVAHVDDDIESNRKTGLTPNGPVRKSSIFSPPPMLGKVNRAHSSPALVHKNSSTGSFMDSNVSGKGSTKNSNINASLRSSFKRLSGIKLVNMRGSSQKAIKANSFKASGKVAPMPTAGSLRGLEFGDRSTEADTVQPFASSLLPSQMVSRPGADEDSKENSDSNTGDEGAPNKKGGIYRVSNRGASGIVSPSKLSSRHNSNRSSRGGSSSPVPVWDIEQGGGNGQSPPRVHSARDAPPMLNSARRELSGTFGVKLDRQASKLVLTNIEEV